MVKILVIDDEESMSSSTYCSVGRGTMSSSLQMVKKGWRVFAENDLKWSYSI